MAFNFGVEFELCLRLKQNYMNQLPANPNADQIRREIARLLNSTGVNIWPGLPTGSPYLRWRILGDPSIQPPPSYIAAEFTTPVFPYSDYWQYTIDDFFQYLTAICDVQINHTCSTHIHISRHGAAYETRHVAKFLKAIEYYEEALQQFIPAERQNTPYAEKNTKVMAVFGALQLHIPLQQARATVYNTINTHAHAGSLLPLVYGDVRNLAWNFCNLNPGGIQTIECRFPPGVTDSRSANHWIAFALGFMANALSVQWPNTPAGNRSNTAQLRAAVQQGANSIIAHTHALLL
ncbi:hypothetical protein FQN57_001983 [Myotisia sp. PD_48]|nr:hypothetical protein FQN57_001983 [Myotisia sp. PD_48]